MASTALRAWPHLFGGRVSTSEALAEPLFGVTVRNPAFDVTPYALVTAIITEDGIWKPLEL